MAEATNKRTFKETTLHYQKLRELVHQRTEKQFAHLGVALSEITIHDAREADLWREQWTDPQKVPIWSWERMYFDYQSNAGVNRFDLAAKVGRWLCGLCYGVPTKRKLGLKLHGISRNSRKDNEIEDE